MASTNPTRTPVESRGRRVRGLYARTTTAGQTVFEYVGRLCFSEEDWDDAGLPDRAAIPGRNRDEVIEQARRLTRQELGLRHRRALAEKRRFVRLRRAADDILAKIRYLNQIAISMRDGLLDEDGARQEIELTERQLHECIDRLRHSAGIEE